MLGHDLRLLQRKASDRSQYILVIIVAGMSVTHGDPRDRLANTLQEAVANSVDKPMHCQVVAISPCLLDHSIGADLLNLGDDVELTQSVLACLLIR